MAKNLTISLSVDSEIKERAGKILSSMGMSFSEAFNLMLYQVWIQRALPFEVVSYGHMPKPETLTLIERIESGEEELVGPFNTFEDFMASLDGDEDDNEI